MKYNLLIFLSSLFVLTACSSSSEDNPEPVVSPFLVSSSPSDGDTSVKSGNATLTLTYDQPVKLLTSHGITLNGVLVTATASSSSINITTILSSGQTYELIVPKGVIQTPVGIGTKEVTIIKFTTAAPTSGLSKEAQNVINFLKENYGKKIISGTVANVDWNVNEALWVHEQTGKYPALNGFDFISCFATWRDYTDTRVVEEWWNNNGLVTFMWHWNVPKSQGSSDYAFYTVDTNFDVTKATVEGSYENGIVKADLKKIAGYLKLLRDKKIPILWRPLHEAKGGWFWWGARGSTAYVALWRYMYDYFKSEGLNNLIWIYTKEPDDNAWYPGNDYVDILGRDIYNQTDNNNLKNEYNSIQNLYKDKMIAMSECGSVSDIAAQFETGVKWSWFMTWYDYDRTKDSSSSDFKSTEHEYANADWWKKAFNSSSVITRDQMPNLK